MPTFLAVIVVGSLASAGEPTRPPADVGRWVEVTVPRDGTPAYDRFRTAATNSGPEWYVTAAGGRVTARDEPPPGPKPRFRLGGAELGNRLFRHVGTQSAVPVSDGWLVGYNAGEFGGAVLWYSADGTRARDAADLRVHQFVQTKAGTYAVTGLAHLIFDSGSVVRFDRKGWGEWVAVEVAELPGCGRAATALADGRLLVAASDRLVRVTPTTGAVETLLSDLGGYCPTSVAVGPDEKVYVGMRQFVAVYDPTDRAGFARLRAPTREPLRPAK